MRRWLLFFGGGSVFREKRHDSGAFDAGSKAAKLSSFIATRFAEGCRDGRHFLPGYEYDGRKDLRDAFLGVVLRYLAKMHAMRLYHKAFKLYNILRREAGGRVEPVFIDVSSCKPVRFGNFYPYRIHDLADLFCPLSLSEDELLLWIGEYCGAGTDKSLIPAAMLADVTAGIATSHFNWKQVEREKRSP